VGDAAFQEKCKVRIRQFKQEERTMMFVSHSAAEVRRLCDRALWMHHGQLRMDGDVDTVVDAYEKEFGIPNSRGQKLALDAAEAKKIEVNTPAPA
jgi:ABC-type polysaccharide/polyol phosphate transport system ATPase subunit